MKKAIYNNTGTKQIVETGFKTFDRQTNCITRGNAYCNTQFSGLIRPYNETHCNGKEFPKGELMSYDLRTFGAFRMPQSIKELIEDQERQTGVFLYLFFIRRKRIEPLCWVLTDYNYNLLDKAVFNWTRKRENAMNEIIKYITNN